MKIGILLDSTLDSPDGVQQFVLQIGGYMSSQGHEVHYLVGQSQRNDRANIHSLARNISVSFNGNVISSPLPVNSKSITALLDKLQLDVLHVQTPFSPFFAGKILKIAQKRHIPVVSTFHILPLGMAAHLGNAALGIWSRWYGAAITVSTAVSAPAAEFAKKYYGFTSRVIPNPIDVRAFLRPPTKNSIPKIVFLGRLVERKGSLKLLEAISYLEDHALYTGSYTVEIGGKGGMMDVLKKYIHDHGLENRVTLKGFISENDKVAFLNSADIAVFPSIGGESFGISLLEAFAASSGVVLAGDNPGYASVVPTKEQLVDPCDTAAFAMVLAKWLKDGPKRKSMAKLQKEHVTPFDTAQVGASFLGVYNEALQLRKDS